MEASQPQDPAQADAENGTQDPQPSQETPTQDSGLQTPQPDQPVPSEAERQSTTGSVGPSGEPAEGTVSGTRFPSNEEQVAAQQQRDAELESARQEHNERTGGGDVQQGELQAQRDEHNERTGGGQQEQAPAESPQDQA